MQQIFIIVGKGKNLNSIHLLPTTCNAAVKINLFSWYRDKIRGINSCIVLQLDLSTWKYIFNDAWRNFHFQYSLFIGKYKKWLVNKHDTDLERVSAHRTYL